MTLTTLAALALLTSTASMEPPPEPTTPTAATERAEARRRYTDRLHTELSFGYLGEWRNDSPRAWELKTAEAPVGAAAMTAPFDGAPFNGLASSGLTVESRVIYDWVRFSIGLRWPFATFRAGDTTSTVDFGPATHEVMVRSLSAFTFRTGLGVELPFGIATPFIDVIGDVEKVGATIVIDGAPTKWDSTGFALGARTGVRLQFSQVFVQLAGEATAIGAPRFGGSLQAGVAF